MFGIDALRDRIKALEDFLYGRDGQTGMYMDAVNTKHKADSARAEAQEARELAEKLSRALTYSGDGEFEVRDFPGGFLMSAKAKPVPQMKDRIAAIEAMLGIEYELVDEQPAKWVTKKAKKR